MPRLISFSGNSLVEEE